jgi:predicted CXXCH cytochrome family protein
MRNFALLASIAASLLLGSFASAEAEATPPAPAPAAQPATGCALPYTGRARASASNCLACHALGGDAAGLIMKRHASGDHNSGLTYASAQRRGVLRLRPVDQLPPQIVLVEGQITCTTCHDGASSEHRRLATPGGMAALCVSCHAL